MKFLAIIPARGGSKRIERKNVKDFAGCPIIAYSIRAALESGCFDEVMVSTDDEEIASTARAYGATVPFMRSAETSDDYATTADVINEVLERYEERGKHFDAIACIYATAPFVTAARLRKGASLLTEGNAAAAFTCVGYSYPIQRSLRISDGRVCMRYPEYATARSQDLEKTYHDAGQFYFTTVEAFRTCGSLWGPDTAPIILPELEVQDLDTPTDWKLAEMKFNLLRQDSPESDSSDRPLLPLRFALDDFLCESYTVMDHATSDAMLLGRNEESVRCRMINRDPILEADHQCFVASLADRPDRAYYAVRDQQGDIVGSFNLSVTAPGVAERGIWIAPGKQGKGIARRLMSALYAYLKLNTTISSITTTVRPDNTASLALERYLGAEEQGRSDAYVNFIKLL